MARRKAVYPLPPRRALVKARGQEMCMTDSSRSPDTGVWLGRGPATAYPGTPRWVKVFGIILLVLVLLAGIMGAAGQHGPGRHLPFGGAGVYNSAQHLSGLAGQTAPGSATAEVTHQP